MKRIGSMRTVTSNNKEGICYLYHKSEGKCCNEKNKATDDCILISKIIVKVY